MKQMCLALGALFAGLACSSDSPKPQPCEAYCTYVTRCTSKGGPDCPAACEGWRTKGPASCLSLFDRYLMCFDSISTCSRTYECEDKLADYDACRWPDASP